MDGFSELLAKAREGDPGALDEVHRRYAPVVLGRIRSRLSPVLRRHYDTLDIGQSVFIEVLRDLPRFEDCGETAFRNWVCIKAESKVSAKLRKHLGRGGARRVERLDTSAGEAIAGRDEDPSGRLLASETRSRLFGAVVELPQPERDIVRMHAQEGATFPEIARRLELPSADAARKRYARALLTMRERLDGASAERGPRRTSAGPER